MPVQIFILNLFELCACITGFLYYIKLKDSYWKYFPFYLFSIFLTEVLAEWILLVQENLKVNIAIYKYWAIPVQFLFFFWLFSRQHRNTKPKVLPFIFSSLYLIAVMIENFWPINLKPIFDSMSYSFGCVLLLILIIIFLKQFISSDEILEFKTNMMFWVVIGLLLFYIGTLPFWGLRSSLYYHYRSIFNVYNQVQFALNYCMYLMFIFAFIWGKPK
ncbi:MAG TPA: hypothetical protein PK191_04515 [Niabella sp.]|nr:hypothetical protein [Niabella sp.]HOZ97801.1 hypothetical protein [Niabella sp.]HQW15640.1 hypothetical protein [Niabella sp.]HQX20843.1 hypothetical protein [Niabella sp.]HRB07769.1 hypothetical protein [Niabella sp.]